MLIAHMSETGITELRGESGSTSHGNLDGFLFGKNSFLFFTFSFFFPATATKAMGAEGKEISMLPERFCHDGNLHSKTPIRSEGESTCLNTVSMLDCRQEETAHWEPAQAFVLTSSLHAVSTLWQQTL
jgi:hypothetical protein